MSKFKKTRTVQAFICFLCCTLLVWAGTERTSTTVGEHHLLPEFQRVLSQNPKVDYFQAVQLSGQDLVLYTEVRAETKNELRSLVEETLPQITHKVKNSHSDGNLVWLLSGPKIQLAFHCPLDQFSQRLSYQYVNQELSAFEGKFAPPNQLPEDFQDENGVQKLLSSPWLPLGGEWEIHDGIYIQKQLGHYDLVSYCRTQIEPPFTLESEIKYLEGEMGGGLVFGALDPESKNGATMVSFTAGGGFLQCGHFDDQGVFTFQDGRPVLNVSDGAWHKLSIEVQKGSYSVSLDGQKLLEDIPGNSPVASSFAGLFVSTSSVAFRNVTCKSK